MLKTDIYKTKLKFKDNEIYCTLKQGSFFLKNTKKSTRFQPNFFYLFQLLSHKKVF